MHYGWSSDVDAQNRAEQLAYQLESAYRPVERQSSPEPGACCITGDGRGTSCSSSSSPYGKAYPSAYNASPFQESGSSQSHGLSHVRSQPQAYVHVAEFNRHLHQAIQGAGYGYPSHPHAYAQQPYGYNQQCYTP